MSDESMDPSEGQREDEASRLARKLPDQVSDLRAMTKAFGEVIANAGGPNNLAVDGRVTAVERTQDL